jgi:hypothetical protein
MNPNCMSMTYFYEIAPKYHKCGQQCHKCPCPNGDAAVTIMREWDNYVESMREIGIEA